MRRDRSLADRNRDREEARVKQLALARRLTERRPVQPASTSAITKPTPESSVAEPDIVRKDPPASPEFNTVPAMALSDGVSVTLQPWAHELAETLLTRTKDKQVSLRLLWPAEIDSLAPLHAVASLSRVLQTDLCGLRTIFYPGTQTTRIALDRYAMPRSQLQDLWRSTHEVPPRQASVSFRGVLEACNDVELFAKDTPPPSLRLKTSKARNPQGPNRARVASRRNGSWRVTHFASRDQAERDQGCVPSRPLWANGQSRCSTHRCSR